MDNDVFIIDPSSGILQTNRTLGQFADGYFNLVFRASNGPGDKKRGDFTTLKVGCLDDCLNHHLLVGARKGYSFGLCGISRTIRRKIFPAWW